jgi:hypothetical protein
MRETEWKEKIQEFLDERDYDIRKKKNARWIDQKCAFDVVSFLAECILAYADNDEVSFTRTDIWHSQFAIDGIKYDFKKPDAESMTENEYNKFFGNSIGMLHYAGILRGRHSSKRKGRPYIYHVNNREILEFISIRPKNALLFLQLYIEKVLKDSDIYKYFDEFFEKQDYESLTMCRKEFRNFLIKNTRITKPTEPNKIFIKVINPLANVKNKKGYVDKTVSVGPITITDLGYQRENWYDEYLKKPKNVSRQDHKDSLPEKGLSEELEHRSTRGKNKVRNYNRDYNDAHSELQDEYYTDGSVEIHHIFPKHEADYYVLVDQYENLIALTISQHRDHAHPNAHMREIVKTYQKACILQKIETVKQDVENNGGMLYSFENLKHVLAIGLEMQEISDVDDGDYDSLVNLVEEYYLNKI